MIEKRQCPACAAGVLRRCRDRQGNIRRPHLQRILLAGLIAVISALARRVPVVERDDLVLQLLRSVWVPDDGDTGRGAAGPDTPDWDHLRSRMLLANALAVRTEQVLRDPALFFDVADLARDARALAKNTSAADETLYTAARIDGLRLDRYDDLGLINHRIDVHRAQRVDAELPAPGPHPATDTQAWTIDYRDHGGFIAHTTSTPGGTTPTQFWGYAPTARSAAATLASYFDQPPTIDFTPPLPDHPQPWWRCTWDSDVSADSPGTRDLLAARGAIYAQHLQACAEARDRLASLDVVEHLRERAAVLNAEDPQWEVDEAAFEVGDAANSDHGGNVEGVCWVPTRLVVTTHARPWGEFGTHRPRMPAQIAQALAHTGDLEEFTDTLFGGDQMHLERIAAWAGPVYRVSVNGNHRVHTARMLRLPWLATTVTHYAIPPAWTMYSILVGDHDGAWDLEQHTQGRHALISGLIRHRILDADLDGPAHELDTVLRCRRLPAPWLLRSAPQATAINAAYERVYPGALAQLGIPEGVGTDPVAWTQWLTTS
ncbi:hypothetical protein BC739_009432 [Kutzneria viridogrisea]|uniref:Uncharacterized protein n=1 Tax=Kutzneria viridogrisea TaxID=47990 RepID=A0ABR6BZ30_9PSEU|nr:hypothetical protein [Kutzneria viridogrisea]